MRRNGGKIFLLIILIILLASHWLNSPRVKQPAETMTDVVREKKRQPVKEEEQWLEEQWQKLTPDERLEQLFLVMNTSESTLSAQVGGRIIFAQDGKDKSAAEIQALIAGWQAAAKVPLLIAVDEEGGNVNRLSINQQLRAEPFAAARSLWQVGGINEVARETTEKAAWLKNLGVNLNLAPVADLAMSETDYIYKRTVSLEASEAATYVAAVVTAMKGTGVGSVLKHFPGYGSNQDTHRQLTRDERTALDFWRRDLLPFQAGIQAGAEAVLMNHIIVTAWDASAPASLSPTLHRLLREDLAFDGVIMTDDLRMQAVRQFVDDDDTEAIILALAAGNDLLITNQPIAETLEAIKDAIKENRLSQQELTESIKRVLRLKYHLLTSEAGGR